nr:ABC transporter permease [Arthrobacter pigmenti]
MAAAPGVAPAIMLIGLLVLWDAAVRIFDIPAFLLPSPISVAESGLENAELLWRHSAVTLVETLIGFALSAVVGILLAVIMVASPSVGRALYPILVGSQVIPKVAIAPLAVVWIGTGMVTASLIAFVMAFFPVVVNATQGLNSVSDGSRHLLQSMRATKWQEFRYLRFPTALPHIITGLQLAIAFAIVGAIVGEFVGSNSGLGYLLIVTQGNLRTDLLFADLIVLTVMGLVLYYGVELIGKLVLRRR